jgi:hypothetical protein
MKEQGECKVCVAPLHCECNGKCQKGLQREQKGNGSDSESGLCTMPTLGIRRDDVRITSYSQDGREA